MQPRVLHIGKFLPPVPGGMESYLADLLRLFSERGLCVAALVHRKSGFELPSADRIGGAKIYSVPVVQNAMHVPIAPGFVAGLRGAIRDFAPTVLHLHVPNVAAFAVLMLPEARRLPVVLHWHADVEPRSITPVARFFLSIYRLFERHLLTRTARVIATSEAYLRASPALKRFHRKSSVIPLFVDLRRLATNVDPLKKTTVASITERFTRILAVGRIAPYKGFDVLLQAVAKTPNVTLTLVGGGDDLSTLKDLASTLQIESRVRFLGSIPDDELNLEFEQADVFCMPSIDRSEAFGLVVLEAALHGVPSVVSDIPGSGLPWLALNLGGILVEPSNSDGLSLALSRAREQLTGSGIRTQVRTRAETLCQQWRDEGYSGLLDIYVNCERRLEKKIHD